MAEGDPLSRALAVIEAQSAEIRRLHEQRFDDLSAQVAQGQQLALFYDVARTTLEYYGGEEQLRAAAPRNRHSNILPAINLLITSKIIFYFLMVRSTYYNLLSCSTSSA